MTGSDAQPAPRSGASQRPGLVPSGIVIVLFVGLWGSFNAINLLTYNFNHTTQDQAIFLQVLHSILHHGDFGESIYHSGSFLRMHFSPIYLLLAPLAVAMPGSWLVALFPLLPVVACGLLARASVRRATGSRALAFFVLVASLFNPLAVQLVAQGIRETMVAALFLALALEAFESRRKTPFVVFCVLASLCKEDIPLVLVGFLLPALVGRRRGLWLWFPPIYGIAAFAVIVQVLMPRLGARLGQGGLGFPFYGAMGSSYLDIAIYVLTHPGTILLTLFGESNRTFFREFLGSLGYLPLAAPELLLVPLSQYLEIGLSASRHVADIHSWYYAPAYPFLVAAFARAVGRVDRLATRLAGRARRLPAAAAGRAVVTVVLAGVLAGSYARVLSDVVARSVCFRGIARNEPGAGAAERLRLYRYYLLRQAFFRHWVARVDRHLAAIPANAPVSAQYPFLIRLAWRDSVSLFPDVEGAEFVVLHGSLAAYPFVDEREFQEAVWRLSGQGFRLAVQDGGLMIFERGRPPRSGVADGARAVCLEGCWRYEAEQLPALPGAWGEAGGACLVRNRVDESASGLAARASSRGAPVPIGRWVLDLEPGRHTVGFWIRVTEILSPSGFLLRLAAVDDETGEDLANRAVRREDVAVGERYRRHDLVVEVPGPSSRRVEIRVEDAGRAAYLIDTVEVRAPGWPPARPAGRQPPRDRTPRPDGEGSHG